MKHLSSLSAFILSFVFISTPVSALSSDQESAITQYCATTKQSLKTLQRTDARTRAYLGSAYESLLSNFITPLSLRLTSANQPSASLADLHGTIVDVRQDFIREYTEYSQSLEELIATDCYSSSETFYNKLTETRKKRSTLSTTTTNLRNLLSEHLTAVRKIESKEQENGR